MRRQGRESGQFDTERSTQPGYRRTGMDDQLAAYLDSHAQRLGRAGIVEHQDVGRQHKPHREGHARFLSQASRRVAKRLTTSSARSSGRIDSARRRFGDAGRRDARRAGERPEDAPRRRRMARQSVCGANRPALQLATAVRAAAGQACAHAIGTERTLEGADHRLRRIGRQVAIAGLAVGAQFKHVRLPGQPGSLRRSRCAQSVRPARVRHVP